MATINPPPYANIQDDCHALHSAFRGIGTDEGRVISILAHRSATQRLEISRAYKRMYGEDLSHRLKSELHGKFESAVLLWMMDPCVRDAQLLHESFAGAGTKDTTLIDILCTRTSAQLQLIQQAYLGKYGSNLESDITCETSGYYRQLLLALLNQFRPDTPVVNWELARAEARELYRAGEARAGTDEESYIRVLSARGPAQLAATLAAFKEMHGHSLEEAVTKETSGSFRRALRAILMANYPAKYFAQALSKATKGSVWDTDRLTQLIVTRAEIDMQYIKAEFQSAYQKPLERVIGELSGDYRHFLLALVGSQ
eukprot:TRINITY_DN15265_c0_g1_i1.p1 TRINITY_DN15265_c0_g1~~TRINITY_DN15265_c0_g1_i1.p1  ORF type:complete len:313 (-),score=34.86 TRINITY_DN15265_c0_g1_i1:182-1120(-)